MSDLAFGVSGTGWLIRPLASLVFFGNVSSGPSCPIRSTMCQCNLRHSNSVANLFLNLPDSLCYFFPFPFYPQAVYVLIPADAFLLRNALRWLQSSHRSSTKCHSRSRYRLSQTACFLVRKSSSNLLTANPPKIQSL